MTNLKIASEVQCTVVVVGDSRTGKTSLIKRFVNNTFHQVRIFYIPIYLCLPAKVLRKIIEFVLLRSDNNHYIIRYFFVKVAYVPLLGI